MFKSQKHGLSKMYKLIQILFFSVALSTVYFGQKQVDLDTCETFKSLEEALKNPNEVFILDLSKKKLKLVPEEVLLFKELRILNLSKNKLTQLPERMSELEYLEDVNLGKNQFDVFPQVITKWTNLKRLTISQNIITAIPFDIQNLIKLEFLDMWSNELYVIPDSISKLENLSFFDLRVIQFTDDEKIRLHGLLPNTDIKFSSSCSCAH